MKNKKHTFSKYFIYSLLLAVFGNAFQGGGLAQHRVGISLNPAPGEKISARDAGKVGGNMVRKMIRDYAGSHSPSSDSVK